MKKQTKKQIETLETCIRTAKYLKERNFNWLMAIKENTIVPWSSKNRLCNNKSMSSGAHFHSSSPPRICLKQKFLEDTKSWTSEYEFGHQKRGTGHYIEGNWSILDLMAHELAHHKTKGHGKLWYAKFRNLRSQLALAVISGEFYGHTGRRAEEVN